jgi:aryl-alcohol dehydrogenase-like predicted oxidoreductase
MQRRRLGTGGPEVSAIGLGSVSLSLEGRPPEPEAVRIIHAALDAGMTWIDTADAYCRDGNDVGHGERLARRALREWSGPRAEVLVATKGGFARPGGDWRPKGDPKYLRAACEASLSALGVDCIGLYQLHVPDPEVYFLDSVGALESLRREGKIRHIGLSNVDVGHIESARRIAPIASVQNNLGPFYRVSLNNGVVEYCERHGIAFIAHTPVNGRGGGARVRAHVTLGAVAQRHGATPHEIVLAWLLDRSPSIVAIPGASRAASAVSSARAGAIVLTDEDRDDLRKAFPAAGLMLKQAFRAYTMLKGIVREVRRYT